MSTWELIDELWFIAGFSGHTNTGDFSYASVVSRRNQSIQLERMHFVDVLKWMGGMDISDYFMKLQQVNQHINTWKAYDEHRIQCICGIRFYRLMSIYSQYRQCAPAYTSHSMLDMFYNEHECNVYSRRSLRSMHSSTLNDWTLICTQSTSPRSPFPYLRVHFEPLRERNS